MYIYLKVTVEKNWRSLNFDLVHLKNLSPGQFLGAWHLCFISICSVLNTLSEYTYLHVWKKHLIDFIYLFLKSSKAFSVSLKQSFLKIAFKIFLSWF